MSKMLKLSSVMILVTIVLDQVTKISIYDYMQQRNFEYVEICRFFNIVLAENRGISFGILRNAAYSNYIFMAVAILVTGILLQLLFKAKTVLLNISYSLIIGGAIGNIIDRFYNGAVIDFIELHISQYYWPAFNVADSAICIGAILLLYDMVVNELKIKKKNEKN